MPQPLVVITGASSGIGEATARAFSTAGHPVLLVGRRTARMTAMGLPDAIVAGVDVTDAPALQSAIEQAEARYGPVDCLVNNAGVMLLGQADVQDPREWQQMLDVNVMGVLNGMHAVLAPMKQRGRGTIVNVSSIAGRKTFPNHAAYCATKFAVHALTENVREEVAESGVRVIVIAPGAVETELLSHTTDEDIRTGYQQWKEGMGRGDLGADRRRRDHVRLQPAAECLRQGDRPGRHRTAGVTGALGQLHPTDRELHRPAGTCRFPSTPRRVCTCCPSHDRQLGNNCTFAGP